MPGVPEYVVNVKLAEVLNRELGIDARAERIKGRRRPDIKCYCRGLIIGIEASYSRSDAEKDAERRIEQGLVDVALALWFKKPYRDVSEQQLYEAIRNSRFDVKIFVPKEIAGTLIPFIEKYLEKKAEPVTGWFTDIDLPMLKTIIENSVGFLIREEEVTRLLSEVKGKIDDFVKTLTALDSEGIIRGKIYDILYKLYGLSVAEAEEPEIAFGHAALTILLSSTFYEHIRARHPELKPLSEYVRSYSSLEGLRKALEDLLKIDYRTAIEASLSIINVLPPNIEYRIKDLVKLGIKLASNSSLLRKDFAGRVYHEISGDLALRKGFATFYTEVPAAYLLASLAALSLLDLDKKDILKLNSEDVRRIINKIKTIKVGDLACGSGTLLTASYSALMRIATVMKYYHNLEDADLGEIGKVLIEEGIYGIDALRYASQITATNLALIGPSTIVKENVYTIYLGYIPEKNQAWLGSLELLNNVGKVGGLLAYIEGGLKGVAERTTLEGTEGVFSIPSRFDMIIMNPPFTRATGRTERFGERRGLFGFIVDESIRQKLRDAYNRVRDRVRSDLRSIAKANARLFPRIIQRIISGEREFRPYLDIGQAGEGLLFLYLAYKYVRDGGVIGFVLPRGVLAGVSWFLARTLLASKFHVKYVIVSNDPENGYNFSEGTSLSETLIVAKRVMQHSDEEETIFISLLRKPSTALEAMMLAEEVRKKLPQDIPSLVEIGNCKAIVFKVRRKELLSNVDNWNRFVAIPDPVLLRKVVWSLLIDNMVELGEERVRVPMVRFNDIMLSIGIDAHQFHDHFERVRTTTPYPIVFGGTESIRMKMIVEPNAYAYPKTSRAEDIFKTRGGKILVPDRIWWDTAHVIALYSTEPVLSNIFYAVRLRVADEVRILAEKALVLWLNTTWGLLTVLVNRQETRGRWSRLKMSQWRLLQVLDVTSLNCETIKRLAMVFDRYADKPLRRIPNQFNPKDTDLVRLEIDIEFLKALNPKLEEKKVRKDLLELYKPIYISLKRWMEG